jgi:D-psicose/D-tagatose/L-ribulose 3-epimerase
MNKIGISWAYWVDEWDADPVPYLSRAKRLGFDILEVGSGIILGMDSDQRAAFRTECESLDIDVKLCVGLSPDLDVASEDIDVREVGIDYLKQTIEAMAETGIDTLGGVVYGVWQGGFPADRPLDIRPFVDRSIASLTEVMKTAEENDVVLCVEPVNRFEQFMMTTAEEGVAYCERVGSPNLKILLDTFHQNIEEDSIAGSILTAGARLHHLHLGEPNRRPPGRGRFPWDEFCDALKQIDFQGTLTMEPFVRSVGGVGRAIGVYRDLTDGLDLDEEAKRSLEFMREKLA